MENKTNYSPQEIASIAIHYSRKIDIKRLLPEDLGAHNLILQQYEKNVPPEIREAIAELEWRISEGP